MSLKDRFDDLLDYIIATKTNAEDHENVVQELDLIFKRVRRLKADVLNSSM